MVGKVPRGSHSRLQPLSPRVALIVVVIAVCSGWASKARGVGLLSWNRGGDGTGISVSFLGVDCILGGSAPSQNFPT